MDNFTETKINKNMLVGINKKLPTQQKKKKSIDRKRKSHAKTYTIFDYLKSNGLEIH